MGIIKKADIIYWVVLAVVLFIVYMFFSSGEFSVIFTLSGTVQTFGFALIVVKIRRSRSVSGLSRQTFINYTVIFGLRTFLFFFFRVPTTNNPRDIYRTIPQATLSSKFKRCSRQHSPLTFCTASACLSSPATTKILTSSSPGTS